MNTILKTFFVNDIISTSIPNILGTNGILGISVLQKISVLNDHIVFNYLLLKLNFQPEIKLKFPF